MLGGARPVPGSAGGGSVGTATGGAGGVVGLPKEPTGGGPFDEITGAGATGTLIWPGVGTALRGAGAAGGCPGSVRVVVVATTGPEVISVVVSGECVPSSHRTMPTWASTRTESVPQAVAEARSWSFVRMEEGGVTEVAGKRRHGTVQPQLCQCPCHSRPK